MQHFKAPRVTFALLHHNLPPNSTATYLRHALVLVHGHEFVAHAVHQKDGHGELSVVHLVTLGPVLATHHGTENKGGHIEGVALLQQLLLFGPLAGEASSSHWKGERKKE